MRREVTELWDITSHNFQVALDEFNYRKELIERQGYEAFLKDRYEDYAYKRFYMNAKNLLEELSSKRYTPRGTIKGHRTYETFVANDGYPLSYWLSPEDFWVLERYFDYQITLTGNIRLKI